MPPLDLPEPDRARLARSPLELVVCQIRHERRLLVADSATALAVHDALGGSTGRYPTVEDITGTQVSMVVGAGAPDIQQTQGSGWRFTSADGAWVISLMQDHFALETSEYTTWDEDFGPRLESLIDAVAAHISPAFEQRIGLRYIDRITELGLDDLRSWRDYLRPEVLGVALHPEIGAAVRTYQQQILIEVEDGVIAGLRHGPVLQDGRVDYQLDYDIYRQAGRPFDPQAVKTAVAQFNTYALQLFQATVTDQLLEALR